MRNLSLSSHAAALDDEGAASFPQGVAFRGTVREALANVLVARLLVRLVMAVIIHLPSSLPYESLC